MTTAKFHILITFILFSVILLEGCYYDSVIPVEEDEITSDLSFSGDIIAIFNKDCNTSGCHNAGGQKPDLSPERAYFSLSNGDYVNFENPEESTLYKWMKGNGTSPMPVSGSVPDYNAKVLAWIKQGAKNN